MNGQHLRFSFSYLSFWRVVLSAVSLKCPPVRMDRAIRAIRAAMDARYYCSPGRNSDQYSHSNACGRCNPAGWYDFDIRRRIVKDNGPYVLSTAEGLRRIAENCVSCNDDLLSDFTKSSLLLRNNLVGS